MFKHFRMIVFFTVVVLYALMVVQTFGTSTTIPLCTEKVCEEYVSEKGCPDVSNCSGIILPSPTICSCCKYCLEYIEEGDVCSPGVPGQASIQKICGPQLTCGPGNVCVKMDTLCMQHRKAYEEKRRNGTLGGGEIEPLCDDIGEFDVMKCIPGSICFCTSKTGDRIFGEMVYKYGDMKLRMDCACSRDEWRARQRIKRVAPNHFLKAKDIFARCLPSGSYDVLQCVKNRCACVDKKGVPQPAEAGKKVEYIFLSNIENGKPWCFNLTRYEPGTFDTPCLKERSDVLELALQMEASDEKDKTPSMVLGHEYVLPSCDPDGSYSRVQMSWDRKSCVDPDGNVLEGKNGAYSMFLNSTDAVQMDCNCARTIYLLTEGQRDQVKSDLGVNSPNSTSIPPLIVNIPQCCPNGNFASWQCHDGECYCVDENGAQTGPNFPLEEVESLHCYSNDKCSTSPTE